MRGGYRTTIDFTVNQPKEIQIANSSRQELMRESVTSDKMVAAYLNYYEVRQIVDVAKTIMARDYKDPKCVIVKK